MSAENIDEELSDFDLKHFCDGNPIYCYYFRLPALQETTPPSKPEAPPANMAEKILVNTVLEKDDLLKMERRQWNEYCPSDEQ